MSDKTCLCGCGDVVRERQTYVHGHNRRGSTDINRYLVSDLGFHTPCWIWQGKLESGYGVFTNRRRWQSAHRTHYQLRNGPIPTGLFIDHLCRNRACVNPDHLEAVTQRENTLRGNSIAAVNARKTHCKRGHAFVGDNTIYVPGGRQCRACRQQRDRAPVQGPASGEATVLHAGVAK